MKTIVVPSAEFDSAIEAVRKELAVSDRNLDRMDKQNRLIVETMSLLTKNKRITLDEFLALSLNIYQGVTLQPLPTGQQKR
jgi:hypothetical protein